MGTHRREPTRDTAASAPTAAASAARDEPLNAVEQALVDARDGRDSSDAWLTLLWQQPLHVATATPHATMGDITPPMYDVNGVPPDALGRLRATHS